MAILLWKKIRLRMLLWMFGISTIGWIKTINDLLIEVANNECYLRIGSGGLQRVTEIVKILVHDPNEPGRGALKEVSKTLPGGKTMKRDREPSGKIKVGEETSDQALIREALEELGMKPDEYKFRLITTLVEQGNTKSAYLDLPAYYIIYRYEVIPNIGSKVLNDEFEFTEDNGTVGHFKWVKD